jgi:hypothetical protein
MEETGIRRALKDGLKGRIEEARFLRRPPGREAVAGS